MKKVKLQMQLSLDGYVAGPNGEMVIGHGMPIFQQIDEKKGLTLIKALPFSCGIVVPVYQPLKQA
jgi:hypothetical protein